MRHLRRYWAGESMTLTDLGKKGVEEAIQEWVIGRNGERDRYIMYMHLIDGPTLEEMQKRLEKLEPPCYLSIDRIKKIILKREEQIAKHMKIQ